jgi:hypothetical protein
LETCRDVEAGLGVGLGELAAEGADEATTPAAQLTLYVNDRVGPGSRAVKGVQVRQRLLLEADNAVFLELDDGAEPIPASNPLKEVALSRKTVGQLVALSSHFHHHPSVW